MVLAYAASSEIERESSSTTVSATIPSEAVDGSFIVAYVMHRSALTPPSGWTQVATSANVSDGSFDQWTSLFYKVASSDAGTSPTWTQASSDRFLLGYHVFTGGGTPTLVSSELSENISTYPWSVPNDGNLANNSLVLNASSVIYETTNDLFSYSGEYWKLPEPQLEVGNRLVCAYAIASPGSFDWGSVDFVGADPVEAASSITAVFTFANGIDATPSAETGQQPVMVLHESPGDTRVGGLVFAQVLWELPAGAVVAQSPVLVLHRRFGRRVIANYY